MGLKEELVSNVRNFGRSARLVYDSGDYTSAFILYYKTLLALSDYVLLINGKGVPKDHVQRFQLLKASFLDLYQITDRFFMFYRDSYSTSVKQAVCDELVLYVKEFAEKYKIEGVG